MLGLRGATAHCVPLCKRALAPGRGAAKVCLRGTMAANPLHDSNAVQEYLVRVGRITARRGRSYYLGGAVSDYQCTTPGQTYTAKVQGEMLYQVTLEFSHKIWSGDCTCPMASGCKHCAAALLGFQARAGQFGPAAAVASSKPKFIVVPRPDSEVGLRPSEGVPAKVRPVKVPPESPFAARLIETLGRQLTSAERQLADKIRRIYAGIRRGQAKDWEKAPSFFSSSG